MTPSELVIYYVNLLTTEYYGLPAASGSVAAVVTQAVADMIIFQVRAGFALATAVGQQLDLLGDLVGLSRNVPGFVAGVPEFAMPRYSNVSAGTLVGFARYAGPAPTGHWARYTDIPTSFTMSDALFRQFIQIMVAIRASDYSMQALDAIFFQFFGNYVKIVDNANMTMEYQHALADPGLLFAILDYLNLLPHGAGVAYTVTTF